MGLEMLLALGAATQVAGSLSAGIAGSQAGRYNAAAAEREAELSRASAAVEAGRIGRESRRVLGAQRAAAAASGVDVGQGSPLLTMLDTIRGAAEDASTARFKGEVRAVSLEAEARLQRRAGRRALIGGLIGAGQAGLEYGITRQTYKKKGLLGKSAPPYRGGYD